MESLKHNINVVENGFYFNQSIIVLINEELSNSLQTFCLKYKVLVVLDPQAILLIKSKARNFGKERNRYLAFTD